MTDRCIRERGGEVNHSSSMSNPDPSRAALADELYRAADNLSPSGEYWVSGLLKRASVALRAPLPGRLDCGAKEVRALLDRNHRYLDSMAGRNELHCGPLMLNHALIESTELIELLCTPALPRGAVALSDAAEWCEIEGQKLGAVDGYDYRSGEEYGLRRAAIELRKRAAALPRAEGGAVMRAALENIASQKTCDELASEGDGLEEEADFVGAYDTIILIARAALSHPNTGDGK